MNKDQLDKGKALEYVIDITERGIKRLQTQNPIMIFKIKDKIKVKENIFDCYSEIRELNRALDDDDVNELIDFMELCGRQFQERVLRLSNKSLNRFKSEFREL